MEDFASTTWPNEKYKWEAVKHFQDNWDINAPDFAEMLERALAKTYNLLASLNNYPKGMIVNSAKSAPEDVRAMFIVLFDEAAHLHFDCFYRPHHNARATFIRVRRNACHDLGLDGICADIRSAHRGFRACHSVAVAIRV